jgi:uncharacterized protein YeaO (DUF488 family)
MCVYEFEFTNYADTEPDWPGCGILIKTKSIYDKIERTDGKRILITRHYPRFYKKLKHDEWNRTLSPSRELIKKYKDEKITWEQFSLSFLKELSSGEAKRELDKLARLARNRSVTLLCYEREGEKCHRQIIRALVAKKMYSY